ncbi:hypothetical protein GOP47_0019628 [Adiantum capillus-veneris]|uniref:SANTA domain-containing protein n=1 Tax=Adiantum capillus-veneris TaxID=13818 RepID=A0A9D4UBE4_ADICA|nr:hypothetical protein GOP47_0019628 [Adiantum capillus-veneris]
MNQKEHAHFNPTYPDHSDSFSPNFEQRRYLHEVNSFEQSAVWNASSTSCCQPSKHHGRHGEPLYRSLLKSHHCSPHSFVEHIEGARHHNPYLFETESTAAGNCLSSQYANHSPCRCGSPMLHESNARIGLKGQSYYPNSALPNEITLYNWYLIRLDDSHSLDIAVGGFLSNRCNEVDRIETTTIVKRLEERKLLTKDGDVINLVGTIDDFRTISNGFTIQTAHTFITGFPHIWKLLVDTVLPAKAAGTVRPTLGQRYMQRFSAFKGLETDLVSYSEGERSCGAKHAPKAPCAEANEKIPESAAQMEQDIFLLDVECQSKEDRRILYNQVQEKELDKNARPEDNCSEKTEHQASHGQKSTLNGPAEASDLGYELDNMPNESMEAAVSEIACGNKEFEVGIVNKSKNGAEDKNRANEAFVEAKVNAVAEADKVCSENLDLATVQKFQTSEREHEISKPSEIFRESAEKKRKAASSSANDVEGVGLSSSSGSQENSARSMEKSCNLFSKKEEELISSVISIAKQKSVVACKAAAKKKGKHKRRRRILLARSKRSTKSTVTGATDLDNIPVECIEAAVSECELVKDFEVCTEKKIKNGAKENKFATEALDEATGDAGAKADNVCNGNLDLATVQPSQMNEGEAEKDKLSKGLRGLSSKKRKVSFNFAKDVEGGDLSSPSLRLEKSARSMEKSCSQASEKVELVSSVISIVKQKVANAKKVMGERKGKHNRRGRFSLPRSKRSPKTRGKNYVNDALGVAAHDAGGKADKMCSGNPDLATVQPSKMNEGDLGKDKLSKALSGSSSTKRKAMFSFAEDVEGGNLSSASLRLENSARSVEKSCSWVSEKEELISSVISIAKQKVVEAKKVIAKRKGKHKRRGRFSLPRSKRSTKPMSSEKHEAFEWKDPCLVPDSSKENCSGQSHDSNVPSSVTSARKRMKMVPPPLPSPVVSISTQLVSKAFGLKTSKSGRLLVPPLAHWCGQSLVRDKDGGIIAIEDGSKSIPTETGCFNFKPPIEAGAKKLQEWLSETASKCLTKKSNAPRKGNQAKGVPK